MSIPFGAVRSWVERSGQLMAVTWDESMEEALAAIEARCEAARVGPWTSLFEGRDHWGGSNIILTADLPRGDDIDICGMESWDQDFIAQARTDLPALVLLVRALRSGRPLRTLPGAADVPSMERRCASATAGLWTRLSAVEAGGPEAGVLRARPESGKTITIIDATAADLDFITHARTDMLHLLQWIRESSEESGPDEPVGPEAGRRGTVRD
jgi:hypothetical protein